MAINILSKSQKLASELRDGIRILAWASYKIENNLKGTSAFEGYEVFNVEWKEHEIQGMNLMEIEKFIKTLGYTSAEIMAIREETYAKKNQYSEQKTTVKTVEKVQNFDEIPY